MPSELPKVKNPNALRLLHVAIANLALAAAHFNEEKQRQHEVATDTLLIHATELYKRVTK